MNGGESLRRFFYKHGQVLVPKKGRGQREIVWRLNAESVSGLT
jgi:hypothetical protein